jgi:hypothetical protein
MSKLSLSVTNKIEKSIRDASAFQFIASNNSESIIDALRQISIRSGMAIYIWSSDLGLVNIKSRQTPLPATRSVLEAVKYATKNHYFAVYVFPGINTKDLLEIKSTLPTAQSFLKINDNTRFLFLVNEGVRFNYLTANGEEISLMNQHTKKYKLRDGKWVLSDG